MESQSTCKKFLSLEFLWEFVKLRLLFWLRLVFRLGLGLVMLCTILWATFGRRPRYGASITTFCRGILVYNICLISMSNSVPDGATNKSVLNIESS